MFEEKLPGRMGNAWASRAEEGRGTLRKAPGRRVQPQKSGGIRMGKPAQGHACGRSSEHIARHEGTRGTETSKYPEEKKSTEIPLVVASERGPAQLW